MLTFELASVSGPKREKLCLTMLLLELFQTATDHGVLAMICLNSRLFYERNVFADSQCIKYIGSFCTGMRRSV